MKTQRLTMATMALLIGLLALSSGCGKKTPSAPESPLNISSPLQAQTSPLAPAPATRDVIPFQLDRPISPGATVVTGRGPAGVPVVLLDVTFGGPLLASGVIGSDNKFELELDSPLEARHRIGITLGNLDGSEWQATDFSDEFHGEEAMNFPQIGFFFDTYMIRE
jgi:hypothetical protein